jgi:tetratricopeptide (TPR) repeat protein
MVHALRVLGDVQYQLGDFTAATELLEASLARSRELGAQWLVAWTLARLGLLAIERRDLSVADEVLAESLSLSSDIGDRQGIARGLEGLAHLAAVHGEGETALRLIGAAAGVRESIGAPLPHAEQTRLEHRLGPVREAMGDTASAAAEANGRALSLQQALVLADAMRVR